MKPSLNDVELFAWVGEDEHGSGVIGLKQGLVPAGMVPLVAIGSHLDRMTRVDLVRGLQAQTDRWGKRIFLARFCFAEVVKTTSAPEETDQVGIPDKTNPGKALAAAVESLYIDDSGDHQTALWEVVQALSPEAAELLEKDPAAAHEKYGHR